MPGLVVILVGTLLVWLVVTLRFMVMWGMLMGGLIYLDLIILLYIITQIEKATTEFQEVV